MHEEVECISDEVERISDDRLREIIEKAPPYLPRRDAAEFVKDKLGLPCTWRMLEKLAVVGGGPEYQVFGNRAVYRPVKLIEWVMGRMTAPRTATSEART